MVSMILRCTTLESPMFMQSRLKFWHKSTLRIILKRELADCSPSREVPVLHITRPALFGGDVEIELGASVHPVRMLPVSGKDVRHLRFGLVYGPKRKRVRFRAPDAATYDNWEMVLEVAVEKAATERPTFPVWPGRGASPSLSVDDGYVSEEFGFASDFDEQSIVKEADFRYDQDTEFRYDQDEPEPSEPTTGGGFLDFVDPVSPTASFDDESGPRRTYSVENEYEALLRQRRASSQPPKPLLKESASSVEVSLDTSDRQRFCLQLISKHRAQAAKVAVDDYFTRLRGAILA